MEFAFGDALGGPCIAVADAWRASMPGHDSNGSRTTAQRSIKHFIHTVSAVTPMKMTVA